MTTERLLAVPTLNALAWAAFAPGTAGEEYVTAGFTGQDPSCRHALKAVTVGPNARVSDVVIAQAVDRPAKPAEVPLP